jgi:hypothetical protein
VSAAPASPTARGAAIGAAVLLAAIAALHVVWTRSPWPCATREAFARTVLGTAHAVQMPSDGATYVVALLLLVAAWIALARVTLLPWPAPAWTLRVGAYVAGGVLALRGVAGIAQAILQPAATTPEFAFWSGWCYSPLALALGVALIMARSR